MSVNHLFYQQNTHKLYTQLNTVLLTMRICDEKYHKCYVHVKQPGE